uniref:PDZ and LIM domain protein Zasp n=1 Tax=Lygus hesperus TaxID=30085 RepID=A0A146LR87_LYGHE
MCEELRLERFDKSPWGFRLTGGLDFGAPLSVVKVTGGSLAELGGVQVGDLVVEISGQSTKNMTHTDAQNIIGASQRTLNLIVMRGSLVTPPDVTPLRGMTPMTEVDNQRPPGISLNSELLNERLENLKNGPDLVDGVKSPAQVHVNGPMTAEYRDRVAHHTSPQPQGDPKMTVDADMTETELDELLTGNEEVLDQGVLGINFKKFMPQVDFIRQSEVFKFLQRQNVHKEISEEVQLEKEPTKRFSTFLQKPRAPPRKPTGPLWIHPRPPRYLSKDETKPPELPKRRLRGPKEDPGHSVLWLFLSEDGEDVEDERWGTVEEERLNMSRNEVIEYDRSSVASMKSRSEGTYSNLENPIPDIRADTSCEVSDNEEISKGDEKKKPKFIAKCSIEEVAEMEDEPCEEMSRESGLGHKGATETRDEENRDTSSRTSGRGKIVKVDIKETTNTSAEIMEQIKTSVTKETAHIKTRKEEEDKFSKQLADIKAQIAALEEHAPPDLQSQLLKIHDHLEKIVRLKLTQSSQFQEEKEHFKETLGENIDEVEGEEEEGEEEEEEEEINRGSRKRLPPYFHVVVNNRTMNEDVYFFSDETEASIENM